MEADPRTIFDDTLAMALAPLHIDLTDLQRALLWDFRSRVVAANEQFNLTRITAPADFAVKHIADSLSVVAWCRDAGLAVSRVLDIGTGAGVPGIPLAIANPHWQVTAIDGTLKKSRFVSEVASGLPLDNVTAHHARAESWRDIEPFDLVVSKAVGSLQRTIEFSQPHLAPGGRIVSFKTPAIAKDEVTEGRAAARKLRLVRADVFSYELSLGDETLRRSLRIFS